MSAPSNIEQPGSGVLGAAPEPVTGLEPGAADVGMGPAGGAAGADAGPGKGSEAGAPTASRRLRLLARWLGRIVVALALAVGLMLLVPRPNAVPLQTVDVAVAARAAAPELGFAPSVPSGLNGWTTTIAVVRHGTDGILTWHVGFVTPKGAFAGIDQATRSNFTWENALDSGGTWAGTVEVNGRIWDHVEKAERDTTSLILRRPGRVTLVTAKGGGVPDAVTLIRSLPPDTLS